MPLVSDANIQAKFQRVFIYGLGKMKKTWWACKAAEKGYKVLLIDADKGSGVLSNLSDEGKENVFVINAWDTLTENRACRIVITLLGNHQIWWDDEAERFFNSAPSKKPSIQHFDLREPDPSRILVIDSWSAICNSLVKEYADRENIDLAEGERTEWEGYAWEGRVATWMLNQIKTLNCHVIIIGHETTYEKYRGRQMVSSRRQPKSTSNPHGQTISDKFDEMYIFYRKGLTNYIDTDGNINKDAGSRTRPPNDAYKWSDFHFTDLLSSPESQLRPKAVKQADDSIFSLLSSKRS